MALLGCRPRSWSGHRVPRLVAALLLLPSALVAMGARGAMAQPAVGSLAFAGCDANIPLTGLLARVFRQHHPR